MSGRTTRPWRSHSPKASREHGLIDLDDVALRYVAWASSGPKDIGTITRTALRDVRSADDARRNAQTLHDRTGKTAGNGTVMRATPIAFGAGTLGEADDAARLYVALTHADPAAGDASATLCAALRAIAASREPLEAARETAQEENVRAALDDVGDVSRVAARAAGSEWGVAWTALAVALHAVTAHDDYSDAVTFAISLGRDTDTNAAVSGALAGARGGTGSIPSRWLDALRERDRLERAALAVAAGGGIDQ